MSEPVIVGYTFRTPPGWEPAPEGWLPPTGWVPPADWPAAPVDWEFYAPVYASPEPAVALPIAADTPREVQPGPIVETPVESVPEPTPAAVAPELAASVPTYEPLAPLPVRSVPTMGKKDFSQSLLAEVAQWHNYADSLKREVFERDSQLERLGAMSIVELEAVRSSTEAEVATRSSELADLRAAIHEASAGLADVRDTVALASDGLYSYHHPAESSLDLQTRLSEVQADIKHMVREKTAVTSSATFTFNNSQAEGRKWVNDISRLMLRAFNAEAENCVKTVRAGNLAAAQKRLTTSADQIAKLGARMGIQISPAYQRLRLQELLIAAAYQDRVKEEREIERENREILREAAKAEKEFAAQREKLERERQQYLQSAAKLEAAGDLEAANRVRAELARIDEEIASVAFREANIRAGHVYVISNIGAFGERMVKIGMTRRLEPRDRIRELGDASVPFRFDTHALIFSQDAVTLETKLHQALAAKRVNHVNLRREFFYATPAEVKELLRDVTADFKELVEFTEHAEADEFRVSAGVSDVSV